MFQIFKEKIKDVYQTTAVLMQNTRKWLRTQLADSPTRLDVICVETVPGKVTSAGLMWKMDWQFGTLDILLIHVKTQKPKKKFNSIFLNLLCQFIYIEQTFFYQICVYFILFISSLPSYSVVLQKSKNKNKWKTIKGFISLILFWIFMQTLSDFWNVNYPMCKSCCWKTCFIFYHTSEILFIL